MLNSLFTSITINPLKTNVCDEIQRPDISTLSKYELSWTNDESYKDISVTLYMKVMSIIGVGQKNIF